MWRIVPMGIQCPTRTCPYSQGTRALRRWCFRGTQLTQCTSAISFRLRSCMIHVFAGVGMICPWRTISFGRWDIPG